MEYLDRIAEGYNGLLGDSLQEKSQRRIDWICRQVKGKSVLDVGCSQGICEVLLGRQGFRVTGIDIAKESIAYARDLLSEEPYEVQSAVQLICADFFAMGEPGEQYDTVLLTEILEHLVEPEKMVVKAASFLRDGGCMVVTVPFGINDFPDHKQTFYAAEIQRMLCAHIEIEHVEFMNGWIGFCGTKVSEPAPFAGVDAAFLKEEENAFFAIERPLRDQLNVAIEKYKKAEENYQTAKKWVDDKNQKIEVLEKKTADLSEKLTASQEQAKRVGQERDGLKSLLEAAGQERDGIKSLLEAAGQERDGLKSSLDAAEKERDGLKSSLDAAEQERGRLTGELRDANRDKSAVGAELYSVKQEREQLREKLQTAEKAQAALAGRLQADAEELEREQAFLRKLKGQIQMLNTQLYQAQQQNKLYEEKLQKVYGTWYGRIALWCYKALKKIKHLLVRR